MCGKVFAGRNAGLPLVGAVVAVGLNRPILEKRQAGVVHEDLDACCGRCLQRRGLGSAVPDGNCERRALLGYRLLDQLDHVRADVVVVRQRDPGVLAARIRDQRTREVRAVLYNSEERVGATDGADVPSTSAGGFDGLGNRFGFDLRFSCGLNLGRFIFYVWRCTATTR